MKLTKLELSGRLVLLARAEEYCTAQAVGHHSPKGGEAYADYVTHRTVHRYDYRKKQQPPLGQVTVVERNA